MMILSDICSYVSNKIKTSELDATNYISTENMLPNKMGIENAANLPTTEYTPYYQKNDILISNIRPYFKKIWHASFMGGCSNDVLIFRAKSNIDPVYLYYILSDDSFFNYSMSTSKGTKMPRGDKTALMNYSVPNFDYHTQCKIGSVLRTIDSKIELNQRINNNLEQQAQALFLQFIQRNNCEQKLLLDVSIIKYGKGLPTHKLLKTGYKVFGGNGVIGYYSDFLYKEPQILISCRGAASGSILESHPFSYVTNNSLVVELNDRKYYEFIKRYFFLNPLHAYATGSAQPQITIDNLKTVEVPYPSFDMIQMLSQSLEVLSATVYQNICENTCLAQLRDTLLPKLMSGEIDVSKVDISNIVSTDKSSFTEKDITHD